MEGHAGFLVPLKTLLVEAWQKTFDGEYIEEDFRGLHVSIEYPARKQDYPGIWVDFTPTGIEIAGVSHVEYEEGVDFEGFRPHTRWVYDGTAEFTIATMTSLERDRLFDEMTRVLAFGREDESTAEFRAYIEDNEFVACNMDFDQFSVQGMAATPGTPWQTDDIIYEVTISTRCFGEFVSDSKSLTLVPLSAIVVQPQGPGDPDPWESP